MQTTPHEALFWAVYNYKKERPPRPELPPYKKGEYEGVLVPASNLGQCPLRNAKRYHGEPKTLEPTPKQDMVSLLRMDDGVRAAEVLQEALLWQYGDAARVEVEARDFSIRITGRIDALVDIEGKQYLYEFKRRDNDPWGNLWPKMSDLYQVMAYGLMYPEAVLSIVVRNRVIFNTFTLYEDSPGKFLVVDQDGKPWESPMNDPNLLSTGSLMAEIDRQLEYLERGNRSIPIDDPLNDDRTGGWYCYRWEGKKPMVYSEKYAKQSGMTEKIGYVLPSCEYFCHYPIEGWNPLPVRETGRETGKYEWVQDETE